MALGFSLTNYTAALKKRYAPNFVKSMSYQGAPLFAMLKKMEDMGGEKWVQPVAYSDSQAIGYTIAAAQDLADTEYQKIKAFEVTRVKYYGVAHIDAELIEASKKDEDAFFRGTTEKIDSVMRSVTERVNVGLYRKGWGAIGQVVETSGTTLTLSNPQDIVNFHPGMSIAFADTEDDTALRDSGDTIDVVSVNRSAGTMVLAENLTTISGIATLDFLFRVGDREDSATPTRRLIAGLEDWCPQTAPASTSFFGVDRTSDTRLGGCRFDGSSAPIEEALIEAGMLVTREGGKPDVCFMNPSKYGDLLKALGSKVQYVDVKTAEISFRALELHLPSGTVKVIPDRYCPTNRAFLLQMDTWTLGSLGTMPRILNLDGLESLRISNDDGIEVRVGLYGNLICKAPGWNCNVKL